LKTELTWWNTLRGGVPEGQVAEKLIAVDVTGRRHTLLVRNADDAYEFLRSGNGDSSIWIETENGSVRYGALAYLVKP